MDPEELARALRDLSEWAARHAPDPEPKLRKRLREHLDTDPAVLPVVSEPLSTYDHPNVQVALDAYLADSGASAEVLGLSLDHGFRAGLAELAQASSAWGPELDPGPPEYVSVDIGERQIDVLRSGLVLIADGDDRLVVLFGVQEHEEGLKLEAMAPEKELAVTWLRRLRGLMREHNVYRGKVLTFGSDEFWRPRLSACASCRPSRASASSSRPTRWTGSSATPPGLARTATACAPRAGTSSAASCSTAAGHRQDADGDVPGRAHARAHGGAPHGPAPRRDRPCRPPRRSLEPAMVVLEDVDLVAMDREYESTNPLLFELLNAMDGLDEDADLIFVLDDEPRGPARAGAREPPRPHRPRGRAAAAGPADRERLLALYGEGLDAELGDPAAIVAATDGTSPAVHPRADAPRRPRRPPNATSRCARATCSRRRRTSAQRRQHHGQPASARTASGPAAATAAVLSGP
jgi:hypothetical protein